MICWTMCFNRFVRILEKRHGWKFWNNSHKYLLENVSEQIWKPLVQLFPLSPSALPAINNPQRSQENVRTFKSILVAIYKRVIICLWTLHICSVLVFSALDQSLVSLSNVEETIWPGFMLTSLSSILFALFVCYCEGGQTADWFF